MRDSARNILAKERVPLQYLKPDLDPELQKWYMVGVAKRLKAKLTKKELLGQDGKAVN